MAAFLAVVSSVFGGIVAVFKAVPILNSWWLTFLAAETAREIKNMKTEDRDAVIQAVKTYDQRPIEQVIGSPTAGAPSGVPGTSIVDELPGVPKS